MVRRTLLAAGKSMFPRLYIVNGISVNNYIFNNSQIFHNGLEHINEPPSVYKIILVSSSIVWLLVIHTLNVIISIPKSSLQIVIVDPSTRQLSVLLQCGRLLACLLARSILVLLMGYVRSVNVCVRECVHVNESVNARVYMSAQTCVRVRNVRVRVL